MPHFSSGRYGKHSASLRILTFSVASGCGALLLWLVRYPRVSASGEANVTSG